MSATEVLEIFKLVFNMELLAIFSMSEVRSEHKVCFGASYKGFLISKKKCDFGAPPGKVVVKLSSVSKTPSLRGLARYGHHIVVTRLLSCRHLKVLNLILNGHSVRPI